MEEKWRTEHLPCTSTVPSMTRVLIVMWKVRIRHHTQKVRHPLLPLIGHRTVVGRSDRGFEQVSSFLQSQSAPPMQQWKQFGLHVVTSCATPEVLPYPGIVLQCERYHFSIGTNTANRALYPTMLILEKEGNSTATPQHHNTMDLTYITVYQVWSVDLLGQARTAEAIYVFNHTAHFSKRHASRRWARGEHALIPPILSFAVSRDWPGAAAASATSHGAQIRELFSYWDQSRA